ncbi:MAG: FAD-binding oxidoreductase, partial [Calditrichaeota bacterium]
RYTLRGAGTWPFGGAIPLNREVILDLSYLDFFRLDADRAELTVGPGVIFAKVRKALREKGFALRQEITNPHSGTICGWIATGGLGLGAYKYGPVRNSVQALLLLLPDGEWKTIYPGDALFDQVMGSEGQVGIIAGAILRVKPLTFVSKPYAFSFSEIAAVQQFLQKIGEWHLSPSNVLYFDAQYIRTTHVVESKKLQKKFEKALEEQSQEKIARISRSKKSRGSWPAWSMWWCWSLIPGKITRRH